MSSPWKKHPIQNNRKGKNKQAPSLNLTNNPVRLILSLFTHQDLVCHKVSPSAEGTSPRSFFSKFWKASMTVEASLVLPMFLLFFLTLGSSMEILRFHGKMAMALWNAGRETCLYGTALEEFRGIGGAKEKQEASGLWETVGNLAFSQAYVRGKVEESLGNEYLGEAPVANGAAGLHYWGGSILNQDDLVEIVVSYQAEPKWTVQGFQSFWMENHFYGRLWTGFEIKETDNALFYLAENAEVYHRSAECSHIKLNPEEIWTVALANARNADGSRYRACTICAKGTMPERIWVSPEGDCYHYVRDCPGLKRTVRAVIWEVARKYRPCSRCGEKKGK